MRLCTSVGIPEREVSPAFGIVLVQVVFDQGRIRGCWNGWMGRKSGGIIGL